MTVIEEKRYQFYLGSLSKSEALSLLKERASSGLQARDDAEKEEKARRLEEELRWLDRQDDEFLQRFLILTDAVDYARATDNPTGPGTGTLPGSVLACGLGLTGPDPVRAGLAFPAQGPPPKLSLELDPAILEDVRQYLREVYGDKAGSVELVGNVYLQRFRQVLTGDRPDDPVWSLPEDPGEGARAILAEMPLDDPAVFDLLAQGKDVCQFQTPCAGTLLRDLRPRSLEALADAVAFSTAGAMDDPRYALYKQAGEAGREGGPYGWLLYREQAADLLRDCREQGEVEALGWLDPELAQIVRYWTLPRAWKGVLVRVAPALSLMVHTVPKSHAAARALLTYQDTWLRVHYPREYERARFWYLEDP